MDETSKTLLTAAVASGLTLVVMLFTKAIDYFTAVAKEKRDFKNSRRNRTYEEIETLKDELGKIYELSANWQAYDLKAEQYYKVFANDHELIGKYTKYPDVAAAARDLMHWCKIVAFSEKELRGKDLIESKKELQQKHRAFLQACDEILDEFQSHRYTLPKIATQRLRRLFKRTAPKAQHGSEK